MGPVVILTIALLTLTAATRDEHYAKEILTKRSDAPNPTGLVSDEDLKDQDSSEDHSKDLYNEDLRYEVNRKEEVDDRTPSNRIKSDLENEAEDAEDSELDSHHYEYDVGNDQVEENDNGMEENNQEKDDNSLEENDEEKDNDSLEENDPKKDADAENSEKNDPEEGRDSNNDANMKEMSLGDWEDTPESGTGSEKTIALVASRMKDPWGRRSRGGWSMRRGGSRRWGSRRGSSSWFSRRRSSSRRGGWFRRGRRAATRGGLRSSRRNGLRGQRRSSWFRRGSRGRRGSIWRKRLNRRSGFFRRRASSRRQLWTRRTRLRRKIPLRRIRSRRQRRSSTIRRMGVQRRIFRKRTTRPSGRAGRRWFSRYLTVRKGQVTFNSEGNNNRKSRFYSRKPHVPGGSSGITIGRGYDMGGKSLQGIIVDFAKAGISKLLANKLAKGAGLKGKSATEFLKKNNLNNVEITKEQQKELFKISYARQEAEAKRLTTKYYKTNWHFLHPKIQEMLIDMKFRGDLRPKDKSAAQLALKAAVKENNVNKFTKVLKNRSYWQNVPPARFNQRVKFLQQKVSLSP